MEPPGYRAAAAWAGGFQRETSTLYLHHREKHHAYYSSLAARHTAAAFVDRSIVDASLKVARRSIAPEHLECPPSSKAAFLLCRIAQRKTRPFPGPGSFSKYFVSRGRDHGRGGRA
jgi:hypothetical protein